jgi:hypothetical protein
MHYEAAIGMKMAHNGILAYNLHLCTIFWGRGGQAHPGEAALLIKQVQDAQGLLFNEVQHILVVHKGDVGPVNLLALVLGLLHLEYVLVEVLLQLLIGQVDAKLLKVILLEALEA